MSEKGVEGRSAEEESGASTQPNAAYRSVAFLAKPPTYLDPHSERSYERTHRSHEPPALDNDSLPVNFPIRPTDTASPLPRTGSVQASITRPRTRASPPASRRARSRNRLFITGNLSRRFRSSWNADPIGAVIAARDEERTASLHVQAACGGKQPKPSAFRTVDSGARLRGSCHPSFALGAAVHGAPLTWWVR